MKSHLVAFRCPEELLDRVDQLALSLHVSRTSVLLEASRLFASHVRARGGFVIPPYADKKLLDKLKFKPSSGRPLTPPDKARRTARTSPQNTAADTPEPALDDAPSTTPVTPPDTTPAIPAEPDEA